MNILEQVMTIPEAASEYNISPQTVKDACAGQKGFPPRFDKSECRKSGRYWLVTRAGMDRLYGNRKKVPQNEQEK